MRYDFIKETMVELLRRKIIDQEDSILAICAGEGEKKLFLELGFKNATISNLDGRTEAGDYSPYSWRYDDAQKLSHPDGAFDCVFVSDGLHHCDSPHRAVLEMYRVARKVVVAFESRDSMALRLAYALGRTPNYEIVGVMSHDFKFGGVNNSPIPNYIYRWTEREFEKTILTHAAAFKHRFYYFYGLTLPEWGLTKRRKIILKLLALVKPLILLMRVLFKKQCNTFCMVVTKPKVPDDLLPWLEFKDGVIAPRSEHFHDFPV